MGAKGRDAPLYGGQSWTACHLRLKGHSIPMIATCRQSDARAHKLPFILRENWKMTGKELVEGGPLG
eukprot:8331745-Pyramimonas_sp.AAC.2